MVYKYYKVTKRRLNRKCEEALQSSCWQPFSFRLTHIRGGLQSYVIGQLSPIFDVNRDQHSSDLVKPVKTLPQDCIEVY